MAADILSTMAQSDLELPFESRLCLSCGLSCGLCCDGTAYGFAVIREDEIQDAERIGMNLMRTMDKSPAFLMACHHLEGTACTRYGQWRPSICGEYFCRVQTRTRKGELSEEQAFARTSEARRLAGQVKALMPPNMPISEARHLFRRLAAKLPDLSPEETRFVLKMFVLERYLDAEFRDQRSGHLPGANQDAASG